MRGPQIESKYIGLIDFNEALDLQNSLWKKAQVDKVNTIIGLEHPTIITLGRRADHSEVHTDNIIPVVSACRGGLATLHSPGQLVIYPIIELSQIKVGVRDYVRLLLQTTENVLFKLKLKTYIDDLQIGLYTDQGKIAFCGLEIKNGISLHGISVNISNQTELFSSIKSCGQQTAKLDRLFNHRTDITSQDFFYLWMNEFLDLSKDRSITIEI